MQIVINKDFSVAQLVPSMVYQNSVNASYLDIFAPFNVREYASVGVNVELPSGEYIEQTLAFPAPGQPYGYGLWTVPLDARITALQGVVRFSLVFNGANETATTGIAELTVRRTAVPVLPSAPSTDVYQQILIQLSALQAYYGDMDVSVEQIYSDLLKVMGGGNFERSVMDIPLLPGRLNGTSDLKYAHARDPQRNIPGSKIYFDDSKYALVINTKNPNGTFTLFKTYTVSPAVPEGTEEYPELYYEIWKRTPGDINVADAQASLYRDDVYTNMLLTIAEAAATYRRIDDSYSKEEVDRLIFDMPENALRYSANIWDSETRQLRIYTLNGKRYVQADLSDMYTKAQVTQLLALKTDKRDFDNESSYVRGHAIGMLDYDKNTGIIRYSTLDGTQNGSIDLPVESIIKSGYFDDATEELVLVLTSGDEIRIPASGLLNPVWVTDVSQGGDQPPTATAVLNALNKLNSDLSREINKKADAADTYTKLEVDDIKQELDSKITTNTTDIADMQKKAISMPVASDDGYSLTFTSFTGKSETFTNPAKYEKYDVPTQNMSIPAAIRDSYGGYLSNLRIISEPKQLKEASPTDPAAIFHQDMDVLNIGVYGKNLLNYRLATDENPTGADVTITDNGLNIPAKKTAFIPITLTSTSQLNTVVLSFSAYANITWSILYTDGTSSAANLNNRDYVTMPLTKTTAGIRIVNNGTFSMSVSSIQLEIGTAATDYVPYESATKYQIHIQDTANAYAVLKDYDEIIPGGSNGYQLVRQSYTFTLPADYTYLPYPDQENATGIRFTVPIKGTPNRICTHGKIDSEGFTENSTLPPYGYTTYRWNNVLSDLGFTTVEQFKSWLGSNTVTMVIETAEPLQTIELSKNTCDKLNAIELLKGYTNIFCLNSNIALPKSITADYRIDIQLNIKELISEKNEHHYTVRWNEKVAQMERLNDAANITTDTSNFGYFGAVNPDYNNPFDSIYPWSGIKLCNVDIGAYMALKSGDRITQCVKAWQDEPEFSYNDANGVWRYRPEFWGRSWKQGIYRYFDVTDKPLGDYVYYPEAIVGRWHGRVTNISTGSTVKTGLIPSVGIPTARISMSALHTYANSYGATLDSIYSIDADVLLCIVEYATMNTQKAIGDGVSSVFRNADDFIMSNSGVSDSVVKVLASAASEMCIPNAIIDIGTTQGGNQVGTFRIISVSEDEENSQYLKLLLDRSANATTENYWSIHGLANTADAVIGNKSGYFGTNGKCNAYYRGLVLFGNLWFYTLGAYENKDDHHIWIANSDDEANNYDALNTSVHYDTGLVLPTSGGYAKKLGMLSRSGLLSIPAFCIETGGDSSNPVGDYFYNGVYTWDTALLRGGRSGNDLLNGAFNGSWNNTTSNGNWNIAARPRLKNPK